MIINSCKTDFEVDSDWKDITVVYGLLNPYADTQYVKINKCFLGDASAYDMAAVSDSIQYANLSARIISGIIKSDGSFSETGTEIILEKTTDHYKYPGIFATDNNVLYRTTSVLDLSKDYKIDISIPGKDVISAKTHLVNMSSIANQGSFGSLNLVENSSSDIEFHSVPDGKVYEVVIRFNYVEITQDSTYNKYIEWPQNPIISKAITGGEELKIVLSGNSFLSTVSNQIKNAADYNPDVIKRVAKLRPIELLIFVGSDDLNTYIEVSSPSDGIAQEKPSYSNIANGIGLFSARSDIFVPNSKIKLSDKSFDSLADSENTSDLKFLDKNETDGYWSMNP